MFPDVLCLFLMIFIVLKPNFGFAGKSMVGNGKDKPLPDIMLNGVRFVLLKGCTFHRRVQK